MLDLILLTCVFSRAMQLSSQGLVIDTDTALLLEDGLDIDDDLHVLFTVASMNFTSRKNVTILGITSTYVNALTEYTHWDAQQLLGYIYGNNAQKWPFQAYLGASPAQRNLTQHTDASQFMIRTIGERPLGTVDIVGIGSLSNIGAALTQGGSGLAGRLGRVLLLGGNTYTSLYANISDANFLANEPATNAVFELADNVTLMTVNACVQAAFKQDHLDYMAQHCNSSLAYVLGHTKIQRYIIERAAKLLAAYGDYPGFDGNGFFPWDIFVAAYYWQPDLFVVDPALYCCRMRGLGGFEYATGATCVTRGQRANVQLVMGVRDKNALMNLIVQRLCAF